LGGAMDAWSPRWLRVGGRFSRIVTNGASFYSAVGLCGMLGVVGRVWRVWHGVVGGRGGAQEWVRVVSVNGASRRVWCALAGSAAIGLGTRRAEGAAVALVPIESGRGGASIRGRGLLGRRLLEVTLGGAGFR